MIHLNLITHTKGVLCNRCYKEVEKNVMEKVHKIRRRFRESVEHNYFGFPGNFDMDCFYTVTKQWAFKLLKYRIFITIMHRDQTY